MLQLFGNVKSRTLRVIWALEEMGLEYDYHQAAPRSDKIRSLNPLGKIPVLKDGDAVLTDSTAIMTYLADKNNKLTFPAGTKERAQQDSHTFFLLDEFDACLWTASRHGYILPLEKRVEGLRPSLIWEFQRSQKQLVDRLGSNPFLMGETMTIPDIIAVHCGGWAITSKFPISEPIYRDYIDRLRARPAFQRAIKR